MRLYRHIRTLLHHRKFRVSTFVWNDHTALRCGAKRLFKPDQYKALHRKLRQALYDYDQHIVALLADRTYLIEVVVAGPRDQKTRGVSIAVYDHGFQEVHHGNVSPESMRWRDGVFYYMLRNGRLGKVSFEEPAVYIAGLKRLTTYQPDWQLN